MDTPNSPLSFQDAVAIQSGATEASILILMTMVNRISQRCIEAGIIDASWLETQFDEAARMIQSETVLEENPEVARRMPITKNILMENIATTKGLLSK